MPIDLFGNDTEPANNDGRVKPNRNNDGSHKSNPLIPVNGPGPDGKKCKHCTHLYYIQYSKRYHKCELRGEPKASPANDHRANWEACGRFENKFQE